MSIDFNKFSTLGFFNILMLILAITVFLGFKYLSQSNINFIKKLENGKSAKMISSISKHSFGIYFIHILIIKSIYILTHYELLVKNPVKVIPLLIVVVFLSSWFIIWVVDKVPYLNKCLGTS